MTYAAPTLCDATRRRAAGSDRARHRVHEVQEPLPRRAAGPGGCRERPVGAPRSLEGAQQVGVAGVVRMGVHAVVEHHRPQARGPGGAGDAPVARDQVLAGGDPVEEHRSDLRVPAAVAVDVCADRPVGPLPVVGVDVARHRHARVVQRREHAGERGLGPAPRAVRDVEDDQPHPPGQGGQRRPVVRRHGRVEVGGHHQPDGVHAACRHNPSNETASGVRGRQSQRRRGGRDVGLLPGHVGRPRGPAVALLDAHARAGHVDERADQLAGRHRRAAADVDDAVLGDRARWPRRAPRPRRRRRPRSRAPRPGHPGAPRRSPGPP